MNDVRTLDVEGAGLTRPGPGRLAVALMALALAACGGSDGGSDGGVGGGSDGDAGSGFSFESASSGAGDQPREVRLSWRVTERPDRYRIEVNRDGSSGFRAVDVNGDGVVDADDLIDGSAGRVDIPLSLHKTAFDDALYRIVALDADGDELGSADDISLMAVSAEELIGYFKASNTDGGEPPELGVLEGDGFGGSVALSDAGDTLAVAARGENSAATGIDGDQSDNSAEDAGAVYVFKRDRQRSWSQQAYIKASNTDDGDLFGGAVALSDDGDTLAVGAAEEDSAATGVGGNQTDDSAERAGAVYVFTRGGQGDWAQRAYLKASNTDSEDEFGASVAISGDGNTLAIGAHLEDSAATGIDAEEADNSAFDAGAVYVYTRDDQRNWGQQAYVKASNTDAGDSFGGSVALSGEGDTLAVGAAGESSSVTGVGGDETDNGADAAGAVYVFDRDVQGNWSQEAYVKASNTGEGDLFGDVVALAGAGDTLAVGAFSEESQGNGIGHRETNNSGHTAGAAYVYARGDQGRWAQQAYVKPFNTGFDDEFGRSLALAADGDVLSVGAPKEDSAVTGVKGGALDDARSDEAGFAGAAYVFTRDDQGDWSPQAYVKASNTEGTDHFGSGMALSGDGDLLAVGAQREASAAAGIDGDQSDDSAEDAGAVYLY